MRKYTLPEMNILTFDMVANVNQILRLNGYFPANFSSYLQFSKIQQCRWDVVAKFKHLLLFLIDAIFHLVVWNLQGFIICLNLGEAKICLMHERGNFKLVRFILPYLCLYVIMKRVKFVRLPRAKIQSNWALHGWIFQVLIETCLAEHCRYYSFPRSETHRADNKN